MGGRKPAQPTASSQGAALVAVHATVQGGFGLPAGRRLRAKLGGVAGGGTAAHRKVEAPVAALDGLLAVLRPAQVQVDELVAEGVGRHVLILLPVDGADEVALLLEALGEVGGDEAAGAGDADLHLLVALGELFLGDGRQNLPASRGGELGMRWLGTLARACVPRASVRVRTAHRSTCIVLCEQHRRMQRGRALVEHAPWLRAFQRRTHRNSPSHRASDRPDRSLPRNASSGRFFPLGRMVLLAPRSGGLCYPS
eukprot:scaffold51468_cov56-Phaeocystis_antarctica.AAC.2